MRGKSPAAPLYVACRPRRFWRCRAVALSLWRVLVPVWRGAQTVFRNDVIPAIEQMYVYRYKKQPRRCILCSRLSR